MKQFEKNEYLLILTHIGALFAGMCIVIAYYDGTQHYRIKEAIIKKLEKRINNDTPSL